MRYLAIPTLLLFASSAWALMPPHITRVAPADPGTPLIEGRIVKFYGYSFSENMEVAASDGAGENLEVERFLWTRTECSAPCPHPDAPGANQIRSVLSVKLPAPSSPFPQPLPLRIEFLSETAEIDVGEEGQYRVR